MADWYATSEDQAGTLAAWARQQGLRYERYGVLPKASELLEAGVSGADRTAAFKDLTGVRLPAVENRPGRWAENLCTGVLPGRLDGTLAHFSYTYYANEHWRTASFTVVMARVLDGIRVARDLEGRNEWPTTFAFEREYGPEYEQIDHGGIIWKAPVEEDEGLVRLAVEGVPPFAHYSLREGVIVAVVQGVKDDAESLYQLCLAASAFADGLRRAARTQRPLLPAEALPDPRSTPYREWADRGADKVRWRDPPPDLDSAATAYAEVGRRDPQVSRRRMRGRLIMLGLFAFIGLFGASAAAVAAAAIDFSAPLAAGIGFGSVMLLGILLASMAGRGGGGAEAHFRREAWGLAAFGREYARSRGLRLEDPDEFRRRFPMPVTGSPQRVMRGQLPGGVEGRVVLWRDRNVPERGFVNMAIVAAPPAAAQPPYMATPADGGWLVVTEQVDRSGRTMARLDAVAAEAARLATTAQRR